jgi:hypothetical protein
MTSLPPCHPPRRNGAAGWVVPVSRRGCPVSGAVADGVGALLLELHLEIAMTPERMHSPAANEGPGPVPVRARPVRRYTPFRPAHRRRTPMPVRRQLEGAALLAYVTATFAAGMIVWRLVEWLS